jgi:hypothetical protein
MYKRAYLPYGKDLHGEELKLALNDIFSKYHSDNMVEKLAPIANSQRMSLLTARLVQRIPRLDSMAGAKAMIFVWHAQWHKPMLVMGTCVEH